MSNFKNYVFFFKQKTAYEMRISDWSSDVCSSDLVIASVSQNGASAFRFEVARAKAHGALQMGRHSRELEAMATERPALVSSLLQVEGARIVLAAGGVLIPNGRALIGAIGVLGDQSDNDEDCALNTIDPVGLFVLGRRPDG